MQNLLKELYKEYYSGSYKPTAEYFALTQKEQDLWDRVEPLIGQETAERLQDSQGEISDELSYGWFREGIRVGVLLMLELL